MPIYFCLCFIVNLWKNIFKIDYFIIFNIVSQALVVLQDVPSTSILGTTVHINIYTLHRIFKYYAYIDKVIGNTHYIYLRSCNMMKSVYTKS